MEAGTERNPNLSAYTSHSMNFRSARFTRKFTLTRSFSAKVDRARSVSPSNRMVLVTAVRLANSVHQGPLRESDVLSMSYSLLQGESFAVTHHAHSPCGDARVKTPWISPSLGFPASSNVRRNGACDHRTP